MGSAGSKADFRAAVLELAKQPRTDDPTFWEQFWSPTVVTSVSDVFSLIPNNEIRQLREKAPRNLATLCYKAIEQLIEARDQPDKMDHKKVINCVRLLTRVLPHMFEEPEWSGYFWTPVPATKDGDESGQQPLLASQLLSAISDLLFCPGFTVTSQPNERTPGRPLSLAQLDSCVYIWEAGVGFSNRPVANATHDAHRVELLKLLLTCLSELIYTPAGEEARMRWVAAFSSATNRHVLPLFTSLLNVVCAYDPVGLGLPYNHLLFSDNREPLVETALQVLIVCLDKESQPQAGDDSGYSDNYFVNYLSRIHRDEDFDFMLKGITRLLANPLQSTYLPNATKKVSFHQELLVLLWKCCEINQKFLYHMLKTSDVLDVLVPILYHVCDARHDPTRVGLIHMGVFLVLLLSGERNFGVRLNKPYTARAPIDVPPFQGTHADLLVLVFHRLITTGNYRLQSLFDCLLTIVVNVSPYLKSLSMVSAAKLVHLVEAFATPSFLFSAPNNHHFVFFLLECFNNIIQYQFDGNAPLVYTLIRKRAVFYQLANLATDESAIGKSLAKKTKKTDIVDELKSPTNAEPPTTIASATTPSTTTTTAALAATPDMTGKAGNSALTATNGDTEDWSPSTAWADAWKAKLPLHTIMRLLQVLVPQVEKICIDKGLTDESEILKFLQHGTLVGLLPVPHPILIRKYQANAGTNAWFRTYLWGVIYLRNTDPPIWFDTDVKLFEIQRI